MSLCYFVVVGARPITLITSYFLSSSLDPRVDLSVMFRDLPCRPSDLISWSQGLLVVFEDAFPSSSSFSSSPSSQCAPVPSTASLSSLSSKAVSSPQRPSVCSVLSSCFAKKGSHVQSDKPSSGSSAFDASCCACSSSETVIRLACDVVSELRSSMTFSTLQSSFALEEEARVSERDGRSESEREGRSESESERLRECDRENRDDETLLATVVAYVIFSEHPQLDPPLASLSTRCRQEIVHVREQWTLLHKV